MLDHFSLLESVVVLRVLVPILVSLCGLRVRLAGLEMAQNAANKRSIFFRFLLGFGISIGQFFGNFLLILSCVNMSGNFPEVYFDGFLLDFKNSFRILNLYTSIN